MGKRINHRYGTIKGWSTFYCIIHKPLKERRLYKSKLDRVRRTISQLKQYKVITGIVLLSTIKRGECVYIYGDCEDYVDRYTNTLENCSDSQLKLSKF